MEVCGLLFLCHIAYDALSRSGGLRPPQHQFVSHCRRIASAIRSGGVRNLIGRRSESDRAADGIQSDGVRRPMTKR